MTRQSMVGRGVAPAVFEHNGTPYVGFEFALRVTVASAGRWRLGPKRPAPNLERSADAQSASA